MRLALTLACLLLASLPLSAGGTALELLQNGGFEQGTAGWLSLGVETGVCGPRSGENALRLGPADPALISQNIAGPIGEGSYELSGWARADDAPSSIEVRLTWLDGSGDPVATDNDSFDVAAEYQAFSVNAMRPPDVVSVTVGISLTSPEVAVCLDDLSLEGPPLAPPTQEPTETTSPSPTETGDETPQPTATAKATSTPKPTATPAPSFAFVNGGFEDGLEGWRKFGGELRLATSPVHSGSAAGALFSTTDSTKWAYQTVLIDPSMHYEFAGYLLAGPGAGRGFLRVSWYASDDASGEAMSTSDSTTWMEGGAGFVYLSTGPVLPPPGALSARPRVMFTPAGAAPATLYFDDLSFAIAAPPTPTPQPTSTPLPATATPVPPSPTAAAAAGQGAPTGGSNDAASVEPGPPASVTAEVAGLVAVQPSPAGPPTVGAPALPLTGPPPEDDGVPAVWLLGGVLFAVALGASFAWGRGRL